MYSGWLLGCSGCFRGFSLGVRVFCMFLVCKGAVRMFSMVVRVLMFKIVSIVSWVVVLVLLGDC